MSPKIAPLLQGELTVLEDSRSLPVIIGLVYDSEKDSYRRPDPADFESRTEWRKELLKVNKALLAEQVAQTLEAIKKLGVEDLQGGDVLSMVFCRATKAEILAIAELDGVAWIISDQKLKVDLGKPVSPKFKLI